MYIYGESNGHVIEWRPGGDLHFMGDFFASYYYYYWLRA